jgi:hypothetical protein
MYETYPARPISQSIHRDWRAVYEFAAQPENLPRWAAGLGGSLEPGDGDWYVDGPLGRVKLRFVERNAFGVLDHYVTLPSGLECYNPLRVVANGTGCEVTFTLYRLPDMSDAAFDADAAAVARDLATLKALLETAAAD